MTQRAITGRVIRAPRRPRQWGIFTGNGVVTSVTEANSLLVDLSAPIETSLGQNMANWTISAIRLLVSVQFQATAVVGDRATLSWGIILVSNTAFADGPSAVPNPANTDADWMAYGAVNVVSDVAAVISRPRDGQFLISNDSMRKVRENSATLAMVFRGTLIDDPISVFIAGRVLYLLR